MKAVNLNGSISCFTRTALMLTLCLTGVVPLSGIEPSASVDDTPCDDAPRHASPQVNTWVKELDDDAFVVRNLADTNLRNLTQVNAASIERLARAAEAEAPEVRLRARGILGHWGLHAKLSPGEDYYLGRVLKKFGMTEILNKRKAGALAWLNAWQADQKGDALYEDDFGQKANASLGFWAMELTDEVAEDLARHVARMPNIYIIQIDKIYGGPDEGTSHVTPQAMSAFQYSGARWMSINCREVNDESLAAIGKITTLEDLDIENGQYTDQGLAHLGNLTNLTRLSLCSDQLTGHGLAHLTNCKDLSILILAYSQRVDPDVLRAINQFTKLESLNLHGTNVNGSELAQLSDLPISSLLLDETEVDDEGLLSVTKFHRLQYLGLSGTAITDDGLAALANHTNLEELDLEGTSINGSGFVHLAKSHALRVLTLESTKLDDAGLAQLHRFTQLQELDLEGTPIRGTGLAQLQNLKQLRELDLSDTLVNDQAMKSVGQMKSLTNLYLIDSGITDAGLAELTELNNLEVINLRGTHVTSAGIVNFKQKLPNCRIAGSPGW